MEIYLKKIIRDIPDFPKPGIVFKDITPVLSDREAFPRVIDMLAARYLKGIDVVAGIESRGFIFGAPLALKLGASFVPIRKKGKLPYKVIEASYDLEYGSATIEIHEDAVREGQRVLIVDDLLATGGTAAAACNLIDKLGATVMECAFVIELAFLNGREKLESPVYSIVKY